MGDLTHSIGISDSQLQRRIVDTALTPTATAFDMTYTIDFSSNLNLDSTGPHLKIAFTAIQNGDKVGSFYSQNVPETSSSSSGTPISARTEFDGAAGSWRAWLRNAQALALQTGLIRE